MSNYQLVIRKNNWAGLGNILKGFISASSISDNVLIECNPDYILGGYDTILDEKHIYRGKHSDRPIETVHTCRFLILKEEEEYQKNIINEWNNYDNLDNPKFNHYFSANTQIDWNYDPVQVHPIVSQRIFRQIDKLQFNPFITNIVNRAYQSFKNKTTLGLSIRTWKAEHENNIDRSYNFDTYKSKILEILNNHKEINKIIISIDNENYIKDYDILFKDLNKPVLFLNKNTNINQLQSAMIKVLILSKCNYFIGNRQSTFSELVFWFSKHQTKVFTVY
jgi:hypothetical protein